MSAKTNITVYMGRTGQDRETFGNLGKNFLTTSNYLGYSKQGNKLEVLQKNLYINGKNPKCLAFPCPVWFFPYA